MYIQWLRKDPSMHKVKEGFEIICVYCARFRTWIPVEFLTGFYVAEVVRRYWDQFMSLPFPDKLALKVVTYVQGSENVSKFFELTLLFHGILSFVIISLAIIKEYSTQKFMICCIFTFVAAILKNNIIFLFLG